MWVYLYAKMKALVDLGMKFGVVPEHFSMDTLSTLFSGWVVFSILTIAIIVLFYKKFISDDDDEVPSETFVENVPTKRKASIIPETNRKLVPAPVCTGGDPDAVRWINNVLVWFYEGSEGGHVVENIWKESLNDVTVSSALENGVLVEILEVMKESPPPNLTSIVVDCDPQDDISMTCEMELNVYLKVQTTRTQKDVTRESEYICAVTPLRGRLNTDVLTHSSTAYLYLAGWPEVVMNTEGVRNVSSGLDEDQLQEVLEEILSTALRKATVKLDFSNHKTFPRFKRAKEVPDPVIPIGYDAPVREEQTHPPSFSGISSFRPFRNSKTPNFQSNTLTALAPIAGPSFLSPPQTSNSFLKPYGPNLSDTGSTDEEVIEEAGESFTSMHFPQNAQFGNKLLTVSEESLIARKLKRDSDLLTPNEEALLARNLKRYEGNSNDSSPIRGRNYGNIHLEDTKFTPQIKDSPSPELMERQSRSEDVYRPTAKHRTRSRSPARRTVPRSSVILLPTEGNTSSSRHNYERDYDRESPESPLTPSWKSFPSRSSDDEDDAESLKKILAQTTSLIMSHSDRALENSTPTGFSGLAGRRLMVKVVQATNIGGKSMAESAYVEIEMDEPAQNHSTSIALKPNYPWEEQFIFNLSESTLELLFEVYDGTEKRFLGLGIVGIEELMATPSQRQTITLQSRPYESDEVSGSLTCEFLFLDRADQPDLTIRYKNIKSLMDKNKTKTTTKVYSRSNNAVNGYETDGVAEAALRDLETNRNASNQTKSTLIIHKSKKPNEESNSELNTISINPLRSSPLNRLGFQPQMDEGSSSDIPSVNADELPEEDFDDRGRSRTRTKRGFFGSIRKRFSRSKNRSRSVEQGRERTISPDPLSGRSVSVERSKLKEGPLKPENQAKDIQTIKSSRFPILKGKGFLTVPRLKMTKKNGIESGSARSSLSGTSAISSTSTKTYVNEASLLVVETTINGVLRHFLVPITIQQTNAFKRKGTKLHIFNEHTFVAKHLPGSTECEVCGRGLGRSFGKQGYECRDCGHRCHKPCHVHTDIVCPSSTVNTMDIIFIKDEATAKQYS